ncbi:MAG: glycosyltransferase [Gammaproteobacteria bacterium]|nr:glycosyltransferase [Gammaproteobacteria bacterium]
MNARECMKVLHVNVSDKKGGAAIAAYRLNDSLRRAGIDSSMLVCNKVTTDSSVMDPGFAFEKALVKIAAYVDRLPMRFSKVDDTFRASLSYISSPFFSRKINLINPDIVNLHWVCDGVLRPEFLPKINAPIVWTMHDAWPFCGTENYVFDSKRYVEGYHQHNRLLCATGFDFDRWLYRRKQRAYAKINNITFVSPSQWLLREAKKSVLLKKKAVICIPNGLDTNVFRPINKQIAKKILGLPPDKNIVLFGADGGASDRRKGFDLLSGALEHLNDSIDSNSLLLTMYGGEAPAARLAGYPCHSYGRLSDDIALVLALSAADVFVIPSLVDNLPNTVLEALACGTAVVGFNIGGMPDMVSHKENGYLASPYDVRDLCEGILYILANTKNNDFGASARKTVLDSYTLSTQAKVYADLYRELLI